MRDYSPAPYLHRLSYVVVAAARPHATP